MFDYILNSLNDSQPPSPIPNCYTVQLGTEKWLQIVLRVSLTNLKFAFNY